VKTKLTLFAVLAASAVVALGGCSPDQSSSQTMSKEEMIERGRHLIVTGDCSICHSPKIMTEQGPVVDSSMLLAGHRADAPIPSFPAEILAKGEWGALSNPEFTAWAGPWGISFASNLTPHQVNGSGAWTETAFIKAMRTGRHLGAGRVIMPPMPWQAIAAHTDKDLKAIFAFFQSLPPIDNKVPQPIPPPAGDQATTGQ
jgi:hypothetical protein